MEERNHELPDPEFVLQAAEAASPRRVLDDYTGAIHALREKNFTFREIAEWLGKFGFEVDHNAVWRAYAKTVPDAEAAEEAEADDRLEEEEAFQRAEINGELQTFASKPAEAPIEKSAKRARRKAKR